MLLNCELESVRLRSCNSDSAEFPSDLVNPFTLKFRDPVGRAVGIRGPHLIAEATIDLESFDSSEQKNLVFRCSGIFQLEYHLEDEFRPTQDEMDAFADRFAVFNAWPYMRETIQSITQRMGFNPPPLPLLRLVPPNIKASPQKTKGYPRSPGLMEG